MTSPIIKGGQGRTPQEIEDDAVGSMAVVAWAVGSVFVAALAMVLWRVFGW